MKANERPQNERCEHKNQNPGKVDAVVSGGDRRRFGVHVAPPHSSRIAEAMDPARGARFDLPQFPQPSGDSRTTLPGIAFIRNQKRDAGLRAKAAVLESKFGRHSWRLEMRENCLHAEELEPATGVQFVGQTGTAYECVAMVD